ncbi:4Fe-4S dicluster domain-containing protein [Metallosphaera tengchongensis]|uniref:4Fe-4S dicluster domain-containing protein n=1 Tax=Metallosphaera tengchongensis TaxID=1532350 RepID=A0A6N0NZX1_9CREN|nr:4Fe-4S binding protein [Metallosphaera tengchongensis]QKR00908.1 4Fe-4S dicluster domain-containing protein [Metallosphaera tengchongensis]
MLILQPLLADLISTITIGLGFQRVYYSRNNPSTNPVYLLQYLIFTTLSFSVYLLCETLGLPVYVILSVGVISLVFRRLYTTRKTSYLNNRRLAFLLLFTAFTSSWVESATILGPASVFVGLSLTNFEVTLSNLVLTFASVTASPWFMINMGIWLGVLGIFRILELRSRENVLRFALMMLSYTFYSIWLPTFSPISGEVQYIPYMWFNGIGTYGPVEPSYLLTGIIGTYAVTAVLSFLFGGRQICSVTCAAPYMLQGTFMDSMKKYNRSSKLGRKTLTSKIKRWYKVVMLLTWLSLISFSALSFLNYEKVISFSILGQDPTMLYVTLYFNLIWYVQFILMPFLGNYSCVNTGICAWGSFNQVMGYLGFFKLRVKDPNKCLNCKTVDCALACPVGLTDMRSSFIKRGEFKSLRCVGSGDCVEECPHHNIEFYDIRSYLRERISYRRGVKGDLHSGV